MKIAQISPLIESVAPKILTIRDLRLGAGSVDIALTRHLGDVAVHMLERRGEVRVVTVS